MTPAYDSEVVKRTDELLRIISLLADPNYDVKEHHSELIARLHSVYDKTEDGFEYRHQYSAISEFLYTGFTDKTDVIISICDALTELEQYFSDKDDEIKKMTDKLIDHVQLESVRIGNMADAFEQMRAMEETTKTTKQLACDLAKSQNQLNEIVNTYGNISEEHKKLSETLQQENDQIQALIGKVRNHSIETITVLSIFAGIVFAFSGGLSMLGGVFSSIAALPREKSAFFLACIILFGLIVYDCIALLLRFTNRLVNAEQKPEAYWKTGELVFNVASLATALILFILYYGGACA